MGVKIEHPEIFTQCLKNGINLFTGAGFSILKNKDGISLPLGNKLSEDLSNHFNVRKYSSLDRISSILPHDDLQKYIREHFTLNNINEKYNSINKINVYSFITTNYDNIPYLINERNDNWKIYDIRKGVQNNEGLVPFIPIHGDVTNSEKDIIIGSFAIAQQNKYNSFTIKEATDRVKEKPVLIWGYDLADSSALPIITEAVANNQMVWVLCHHDGKHEDEFIEKKELYAAQHFNIIEGDTESLLDWIENNIDCDFTNKESKIKYNNFLESHRIKTNISEIRLGEKEDYFKEGITTWYPIFKGWPYERSEIFKIYESALTKRNVIIKGAPFSGKSTMLMQVARKVTDYDKFYFNDLTDETLELFLSKVKNNKCWLFIDDCTSLSLFEKISQYENLYIIVASLDLTFESEKYYLKRTNYDTYDITDITNIADAHGIYDTIPKQYIKKDFVYRENYKKYEKYSLLELVNENVNTRYSKNIIRKVLLKIADNDDQNLIELIALTVYLSSRFSALTTDVMMGYFNISKSSEILDMIEKVNNLLSEISNDHDIMGGNNISLEDQDYYYLRSGLFSFQSILLFERRNGDEKLRLIYGRVVKKLIMNVIPLRIWRYSDFRKKEYDSELFYVLYGQSNTADEIYAYLYEYMQSPFVLQQWALYHRRCGRFKEAFDEITTVISKLPGNPSVKNSYAIILFEMNQNESDSISIEKMKKAMSMLEDLHDKDYRTFHHTEKYTDYALFLSSEKQISDYVRKAYDWLEQLDRSLFTKHLEENEAKLKRIISDIDKNKSN